MRIPRKALLISAFLFACLLLPLLSLLQPLPATAVTTPPESNCRLNALSQPAQARRVEIESVIDGDSVRLSDGRNVRLIGINTPELDHQQGQHQPLAKLAQTQLEQLITNNTNIQLLPGQQPRDRHGRTLAHLFLDDGRHLASELLRQGLGFTISIAPNLALRDCLLAAEQQARTATRGVWKEPAYQPKIAAQLRTTDGGFQRVTGQISGSGKLKKGVYIELDNRLFIRLTGQAAQWVEKNIKKIDPENRIEVRGWVVKRRLTKSQEKRGYLPFLLNINHPDGLLICQSAY